RPVCALRAAAHGRHHGVDVVVQAVKLVAAHDMQLVDMPDPEPGPGDVVVRVDGCGICGSDLSSYKVGLFTDTVPGHELAGTVAALRARGVDTVVGVDPVEDRRRIALDLGASNVVAAVHEVRGVTQPAYAVFECSGRTEVLQAATDLVAPGGKLVMVGVPFGEAKVAPLMWVTREIDIVGSIASTEAA